MLCSVRLLQLALVTILATAAAPTAASAAVPETINIAGRLTAVGGGQVADGDYQLTFRLYATKDAKVPVWTEQAIKVAVQGGAFRHVLGSIAPLNVGVLVQARYVGLQVAAEAELARNPVHSAPFAMLAGVAHGVACTGCISMSALKADGGLDLGGNALKAKAISAGSVQGTTITAGSFIGDGSKLTGVGAKPGKCPAGQLVSGIGNDGALICLSAAGSLPKDGLEKVSNGVLSNDYIISVSSKVTPIKIEDNNPIGVYDSIVLPDVGTVQKLSVSIKIGNSDISTLEVVLYDPTNKAFVLHKNSGNGNTLQATYPTPTQPVSGDLAAWNGKNPKGKWLLRVIDTKPTNGGFDGEITSWSVGGGGLSDKVVTGKGVIWGKNGLQTQASNGPPAACTPLLAGRIYLDTGKGGFYVCDGGDWRRLLMQPLCGNKVVNSDETCDDGNLVNGDGCTAKCQKNVCGDGIVWDGKEQCDDGNQNDADACSNKCISIFKTVTFTTCGQSGRLGPSQAKCNAAYPAGNELNGKVTVSGGIQSWKVPYSGKFRIETWGARGGNAAGQPGGKGARMAGDFALNAGDTLWILVGQMGGDSNSSGGGGGSFVGLGATYQQAKALNVAGGGGGGRTDSHAGPGRPGNTTTSGSAGKYAGGTNGNGGKRMNAASGGFAGGGYLTDGQQGGASGTSGLAFVNGGAGGKRQDNGANRCADGGFGGGGGGMHNSNQGSGGGGGYSGGGAGHDSGGPGYGGGGGSINIGQNTSNSEGANATQGKVVISAP